MGNEGGEPLVEVVNEAQLMLASSPRWIAWQQHGDGRGSCFSLVLPGLDDYHHINAVSLSFLTVCAVISLMKGEIAATT